MATFHVDSEALAAKSSEVQGTIDRIRTEVSAMQGGLRELEAMWTGQAAANFQQLITEWHATQLKVEESLTSINAALSQASQQYASAEDANARLFMA
jgi:6 kDa early secretory antigenic target